MTDLLTKAWEKRQKVQSYTLLREDATHFPASPSTFLVTTRPGFFAECCHNAHQPHGLRGSLSQGGPAGMCQTQTSPSLSSLNVAAVEEVVAAGSEALPLAARWARIRPQPESHVGACVCDQHDPHCPTSHREKARLALPVWDLGLACRSAGAWERGVG